ncbi:receptor-like kinase TMK4 [Diospyros lotus]|uniref:receptor-like kinase TMK4 n=1 Tax=Diospyros lotus TaxID=55363 RepID=UPI002256EDD7|nr:receptor-like kinase TMK4 [Diospyros lotus]
MEGDERHHGKRINFFLALATLLIAATSSLYGADSLATKEDAAIMAKLATSLTRTPPSWSANDPCRWTGITCDSSGHVTAISLASKSLSGQLPSELTKLYALRDLSLQRNQISGPLPSLANLPSLQQIFLDTNNFTSVPSPFLSGLTSLRILSMADNPNLAPWSLPGSLADSSALSSIDAEQCNLIGTLPDIFGSLPNLQEVRLSHNNLTGPLPPSFSKSGVQRLWLNNQAVGLSGRIDAIGGMSQLTQVWLHQNLFTGPIPDLSGCTSLFDISLRNNELTGPVPSSLTTLPKLANISLQNNKLQGPLPRFPKNVMVSLGKNNFCNQSPKPCDPQVTTLLDIIGAFGYPNIFAESWSGNDPCKGWKSVSCDSKGRVTVLNFGKQGLVGTISLAIGDLNSLKNLLLNDNNLTGTIPPNLTKLPQLQLVDLSNNNISGKIPAFESSVTLKTSGNPNIGKDLPSDGSGKRNGMSGLRPWLIAAAIVLALICMVALSLLIYKQYVKNHSWKYYRWIRYSGKAGNSKSTKDGTAIGSSGPGSEAPSRSSCTTNSGIQALAGGNAIPVEVLREATSNYSEHNVLGEGGFGIVYRGRLPDGTQIAVKRMVAIPAISSKGLREFEAEIAVLSKVRHRHLVALHGFCIHENERLLVYEYMPQGTLGQHLFSYKEMGYPPLTWKQRLTIVLDVARGIEYLHGLAQESFVHRDLKPSNILLGDDLRAKVSDFGLVKNAPDGKHSVETRLAGTFGYMAPEYAATGKVTTKADVFAFGVVLMETITGRKALDESLPDEESHLVGWFRRQLLNNKDSIRRFVDPSLPDPDEETLESIYKVAELAGHCTARDPRQRPDMGHAVNVLSPLVDQWKPQGEHGFGFELGMSLPQALQKWRSGEDSIRTSSFTNPSEPSAPSTSFKSRDGR